MSTLIKALLNYVSQKYFTIVEKKKSLRHIFMYLYVYTFVYVYIRVFIHSEVARNSINFLTRVILKWKGFKYNNIDNFYSLIERFYLISFKKLKQNVVRVTASKTRNAKMTGRSHTFAHDCRLTFILHYIPVLLQFSLFLISVEGLVLDVM